MACTDALCINILPSAGSALLLNEVWNHVWAGEFLNNSRGEENGEKEGGRQKSRGMGPGGRGAWELMGCKVALTVQCIQLARGTQGSPSSLSPPLPGKVLVQHVLAHEMSKTAHLCGWWTWESQWRRWAGENVLALMTAAQMPSSTFCPPERAVK